MTQFLSEFYISCKNKNIDECKKILNIISHDTFLINLAFNHSCYKRYYDLCLYMCNTYNINYNYNNQECMFNILHNNNRKDGDKIIKILKYIFKSNQITIINDLVVDVLCKYCNISIIKCFIKYFNGKINFDKSEHISCPHVFYRNYMLNIGSDYNCKVFTRQAFAKPIFSL